MLSKQHIALQIPHTPFDIQNCDTRQKSVFVNRERQSLDIY